MNREEGGIKKTINLKQKKKNKKNKKTRKLLLLT
jgi:hypothetical protein